MEAIVVRSLRVISLTVFLFSPLQVVEAGSARTRNFIVTAPTPQLAKEIADEAERFRKELAISWLGRELPAWREPCPVRADVNPRKGAGGATSFLFETEQRQFARPVGDGLFQSKPAGRPFGWEMTLQGSRERILDSVLPHEVTHTIFATYFGRPLPRWADEGACTTVEHESEKTKQHRMLYEFLTTDRGIAFNRMFAMTEYPKDILPLYSQGFSLARYLIEKGGRRKFVDYIGSGLESNNWTAATQQFYGFESISDLQVTWLDWVRVENNLPSKHRNPARPKPATLIASRSNPQQSQSGPPRNANSNWTANSRSPQALAMATGRKSVGPPRPNTRGNLGAQAGPSNSWYAQQKSNSQASSARPTAEQRSQGTFTPRGEKPRVASRVNRSDEQREVILEWGEPSDFLNPSLATRSARTKQR